MHGMLKADNICFEDMEYERSPVQLPSVAPQASRCQLLELPNELLQQIACDLPTDRDVLSLSQSCKEMWGKVFEAESAVWRDRFSKHYDLPAGKPSKQLKIEYQIRAIVLDPQISFGGVEDDRQYLWMEVIKTMLEESQQATVAPGKISKTLDCIGETLKRVDFLSEFQKQGTISQLFYALQLCLSPFALNPTVTQSCRRTDYNMEVVYSCTEGVGSAYIGHDDLDLSKLVHMRCFWQRHLLNASEFTYHDSFAGLAPKMRPKMGRQDPVDITKIGQSWLGYYSCMHPISDLLEIDRQTCADFGSHGDTIDVMVLDLVPSESLFWPEECRKLIPLVGGTETKRSYFDGKQRYHASAEGRKNHVFGFTEEIDFAHGGFRGWTRICFTIVQAVEEDEDKPSYLVLNTDCWIHAYEAVITPGGCLMIGRWLDMNETEAKGPFILWDV
ncbi:hypothetical protein N7457_002387 [Penicillium paradoxum]|uniref:uncharacterized protein n=1 Tax=Penicillium paradoxum TaxID=176176 RepID=UPI00254803B1|nr:uncharacterized protein N7457_002387 [Penicillium paradoxum]KAJ5787397.1 hypothetical protein N7457_002387 [Penicillium paradoxum]